MYTTYEAVRRLDDRSGDECEACRVVMARELKAKNINHPEIYWILSKPKGQLVKHRLTGNCNCNPKFQATEIKI